MHFLGADNDMIKGRCPWLGVQKNPTATRNFMQLSLSTITLETLVVKSADPASIEATEKSAEGVDPGDSEVQEEVSAQLSPSETLVLSRDGDTGGDQARVKAGLSELVCSETPVVGPGEDSLGSHAKGETDLSSKHGSTPAALTSIPDVFHPPGQSSLDVAAKFPRTSPLTAFQSLTTQMAMNYSTDLVFESELLDNLPSPPNPHRSHNNLGGNDARNLPITLCYDQPSIGSWIHCAPRKV